jgi:hypothetical protein
MVYDLIGGQAVHLLLKGTVLGAESIISIYMNL